MTVSLAPERGPASAVSGPARPRLVVYDAAKVVAALGVVMFHARAPHKDLWYAGMFLFVFFVGYWPGRARATGRLADLARERAARLLLPWLFWCLVYSPELLRSPHGWLADKPAPWLWLAIGPSNHLWFLPFAFAAGLGFAALRRLPVPPFPARLAILAALTGGGFWFWHLTMAYVDPPIGQWLVSLPLALGGFVIALNGAIGERRGETLASFAVLIAVAALAVALGQWDGAAQSLIIAPLCCVALILPGRERPLPRQLGDLAFGVYLVHPIMIMSLLWLMPALHLARWLLGLLAFAAALGATALIRRFAFGRMVT